MERDTESKILEFIKNRNKKGETTASRHIHIRFDVEIVRIDQILKIMTNKGIISKIYDKEYQEDRFTLNPVKE